MTEEPNYVLATVCGNAEPCILTLTLLASGLLRRLIGAEPRLELILKPPVFPLFVSFGELTPSMSSSRLPHIGARCRALSGDLCVPFRGFLDSTLASVFVDYNGNIHTGRTPVSG